MHRLHVHFKPNEKKDKKEKSDEKKHHSLHHHEAPAAPEEVPLEVMPEVPPVATTPGRRKSKRLGHQRISGFFSGSEPLVEPEPMPLKRMPSVKITDDLLKNLWATWDEGNQGKRPAQWLVLMSQLAIKTMLSQHVEFTKEGVGLMATLKDVSKVLYEQVNFDETMRREYEVDPDLYKAKQTFQQDSAAYQKAYDARLLAHKTDVERLRAKIEDIDQKKTDVTAETVIQKLKDLTVYQALHQEIMENIRRIEQVVDMQGCMKKAFFCKPDAEVTRLSQKLGALENQRMAMATGNADEIRKILMDKLEADREATRVALDALTKQMPVFNDEAHQKYIQVEATVLNAEQVYYQQLSPSAMQLFLRVLLVLETLAGVIPRPNPLVSSMNTPSLSAIIEPPADARLCALIDELCERFRGQLLDYYCMEPGKYLFDVYYQRVHALPPAKQLAFLTGKTDADILHAIFPHLAENVTQERSPSMHL